jgi:hypothetical protein
LRDRRTYGSENLSSAKLKDFFDSIGPIQTLVPLSHRSQAAASIYLV